MAVFSLPNWEDATAKDLLKEIKRRVRKYAGPRCKETIYSCFCCQAWMAYDCLEDLLTASDKWEERKKRG